MLSPGETLEAGAFADVEATNGLTGLRVGEDVKLRDLESEHVTRVINRVGNLKKAATILGVDASTLWRMRKRRSRRFPIDEAALSCDSRDLPAAFLANRSLPAL